MEVTAERAIEIIEEKREVERNRLIQSLGADNEIQVLNGRFGAYFTRDKINYKIPKGTDAATLTLENCLELIAAQPDAANKKKFGKKAAPAKASKAKATKEPKAKAATSTKPKAAATKPKTTATKPKAAAKPKASTKEKK